jgi:hypothetical protein
MEIIKTQESQPNISFEFYSEEHGYCAYSIFVNGKKVGGFIGVDKVDLKTPKLYACKVDSDTGVTKEEVLKSFAKEFPNISQKL